MIAFALLLAAVLGSLTAEFRLTLTAFGPVRLGMNAREVQAAIGALAAVPSATEGCQQTSVARDPGVLFMFENGRVTRIDIRDAHHQTLSGLRVGDTEQHAKALYGGRLEVSPHKYVESGHYLTLRSADRRHALVIETDGSYVTKFRTGKVPSVEYVEGCS